MTLNGGTKSSCVLIMQAEQRVQIPADGDFGGGDRIEFSFDSLYFLKLEVKSFPEREDGKEALNIGEEKRKHEECESKWSRKYNCLSLGPSWGHRLKREKE